jgi:hypothetical protein
MGLMRFSLDGIAAFRNRDQEARARHFCVDCARQGKDQYTLIPYLRDQLNLTLSDYGQDLGSIMFCDKCEKIIATHYPDSFWGSGTPQQGDGHNGLLFKKF